MEAYCQRKKKCLSNNFLAPITTVWCVFDFNYSTFGSHAVITS